MGESAIEARYSHRLLYFRKSFSSGEKSVILKNEEQIQKLQNPPVRISGVLPLYSLSIQVFMNKEKGSET